MSTSFLRSGLPMLVIGLALGSLTPSTAQAQFVGSVQVYNLPSYQPVAPVVQYGYPVPNYPTYGYPVYGVAPVVVNRPVYVPQPVPVPVAQPYPVFVPQTTVVHSAYYSPHPVPAAVVPSYYRSSFYAGPYSSRTTFRTYGPGPDFTSYYRATPHGYVYRERGW
jgi:hypothetical protein